MPQVALRVSGACGLDLMLVDVDVGNRRLTIADRVRPLDDLRLKLLLDGWSTDAPAGRTPRTSTC
ncbi:hypothetical protein [Streptomyces sp. NPDC054794]